VDALETVLDDDEPGLLAVETDGGQFLGPDIQDSGEDLLLHVEICRLLQLLPGGEQVAHPVALRRLLRNGIRGIQVPGRPCRAPGLVAVRAGAGRPDLRIGQWDQVPVKDRLPHVGLVGHVQLLTQGAIRTPVQHLQTHSLEIVRQEQVQGAGLLTLRKHDPRDGLAGAIIPQAVAVRVTLRIAQLVKQGVCAVGVELYVRLAQFLIVERRVFRRPVLYALPVAVQQQFAHLVPVDRQRQGDARVAFLEELAQPGILGGEVRGNALDARPTPDLHAVPPLGFPFLEDRVVGELAGVAPLAVDFAVHTPHHIDLGIGKVAEGEFVDIGQLVAGRVYFPEIGVPLQDDVLVRPDVRADPRFVRRPLDSQVLVVLVEHHLRPVIPGLTGGDQGIERGLVRVLGVELLHEVGGRRADVRQYASVIVEQGVRPHEGVGERIVVGRSEGRRDALPIDHAGQLHGHGRRILGVQDQVLPPEAKVLGRERMPVGPFQTLAQGEGPDGAIGIDRP